MMKKIAQAQNEGILTENEAKVMNYLMTDGYYAEYSFSDVTVGDIASQIAMNIKSAKGVVGSLVKKGFLYVSDPEPGIPPIVYATNKGYQLDDEYDTKWKEEAEL